MMNMIYEKAFTLTEMLVVMTIILILASVVMVATIRAMKRAEYVEGVSDTRQENIETLIEVIESGEGYDALPEHLKEGRFGEKE